MMLDGIWRNNVTFVQVLAVPADGGDHQRHQWPWHGVLTMLVMAGANLLVSLLRPVTPRTRSAFRDFT